MLPYDVRTCAGLGVPPSLSDGALQGEQRRQRRVVAAAFVAGLRHPGVADAHLREPAGARTLPVWQSRSALGPE